MDLVTQIQHEENAAWIIMSLYSIDFEMRVLCVLASND